MRWKEFQSYILPLRISLLVTNLKVRFSLLQLCVILPFAQGQSSDVRLEAGWCAEFLVSVPVICFDSKLITVALMLLQGGEFYSNCEECRESPRLVCFLMFSMGRLPKPQKFTLFYFGCDGALWSCSNLCMLTWIHVGTATVKESPSSCQSA